MIRLFFAVPDIFPPWRLDVEELFARQMPSLGVSITWSMRRNQPGPCVVNTHRGQCVYLPWRLPISGMPGKIINKLSQYVCEFGLFARLLFGPRYDIIQVRDRRYLFAFLGWLSARLRRSKFIYWCSYPFPEHLLEAADAGKGLTRLLNRLRGRLSWLYVYRFVMHVADHVFVQSEQMRRDLADYGVPWGKMTPVPMGVPPHLVKWVDNHETEEIQAGKVVYVGTLARIRRLGMLIEAFRLVRERNPFAHLYIIGAGDAADERNELEAQTHQLGLSEAVTFTGFVPMEEAWRHAATSEVCLSPIYPTFVLRAGSPTKLVEYMALGRPVIANDHPEQAAVLAESGAGLCVPWGAEPFAKAILELLGNTDRARAMGACGPAWVSLHRTYDKLAAGVVTRYLILLGRTV